MIWENTPPTRVISKPCPWDPSFFNGPVYRPIYGPLLLGLWTMACLLLILQQSRQAYYPEHSRPVAHMDTKLIPLMILPGMSIFDSTCTAAVTAPELPPPAHEIHEDVLKRSICLGSQVASQLVHVDAPS